MFYQCHLRKAVARGTDPYPYLHTGIQNEKDFKVLPLCFPLIRHWGSRMSAYMYFVCFARKQK